MAVKKIKDPITGAISYQTVPDTQADIDIANQQGYAQPTNNQQMWTQGGITYKREGDTIKAYNDLGEDVTNQQVGGQTKQAVTYGQGGDKATRYEQTGNTIKAYDINGNEITNQMVGLGAGATTPTQTTTTPSLSFSGLQGLPSIPTTYASVNDVIGRQQDNIANMPETREAVSTATKSLTEQINQGSGGLAEAMRKQAIDTARKQQAGAIQQTRDVLGQANLGQTARGAMVLGAQAGELAGKRAMAGTEAFLKGEVEGQKRVETAREQALKLGGLGVEEKAGTNELSFDVWKQNETTKLTREGWTVDAANAEAERRWKSGEAEKDRGLTWKTAVMNNDTDVMRILHQDKWESDKNDLTTRGINLDEARLKGYEDKDGNWVLGEIALAGKEFGLKENTIKGQQIEMLGGYIENGQFVAQRDPSTGQPIVGRVQEAANNIKNADAKTRNDAWASLFNYATLIADENPELAATIMTGITGQINASLPASEQISIPKTLTPETAQSFLTAAGNDYKTAAINAANAGYVWQGKDGVTPFKVGEDESKPNIIDVTINPKNYLHIGNGAFMDNNDNPRLPKDGQYYSFNETQHIVNSNADYTGMAPTGEQLPAGTYKFVKTTGFPQASGAYVSGDNAYIFTGAGELRLITKTSTGEWTDEVQASLWPKG